MPANNLFLFAMLGIIVIQECFVITWSKMSVTRRTKGGEIVTDPNLYPFMVAIHYKDKIKMCSGSLVDEWTILTASHCIVNETNGISHAIKAVEVGALNVIEYLWKPITMRNFTELVYYVSPAISSFKLWRNLFYTKYDVAVIKTTRPFTSFKTVQLNFNKTAHTFGTSESVWIVGYGRNSSRRLSHVQVPYIEEINGYLRNSYHSKATRRTSGKGDSGGPLLLKTKDQEFQQFGITNHAQKGSLTNGWSFMGRAFFASLKENRKFLAPYLGKVASNCGDIDLHLPFQNDDYEPNQQNHLNGFKTRYLYPWLMSIVNFDGVFVCHAIYVGNNTLLVLKICFNGTDPDLDERNFQLISNWQYEPGELIQFIPVFHKYVTMNVDDHFMLLRLKYDKIDLRFYCRPICLHNRSVPEPSNVAQSIMKDKNGDERVEVMEISSIHQSQQIVCTTSMYNNACYPKKPLLMGAPLLGRTLKGKFYLIGMHLNIQGVCPQGEHEFVLFNNSLAPPSLSTIQV